MPQFKKDGVYDDDILPAVDSSVTLEGVAKPVAVKLLAEGSQLKFDYAGNKLTIEVPATKRTKLVDLVEVKLR